MIIKNKLKNIESSNSSLENEVIELKKVIQDLKTTKNFRKLEFDIEPEEIASKLCQFNEFPEDLKKSD